ncbi:uncharacterized protein LOC143886710 [Tasmannia lanceolata]|uniref:uncharacterized protein LOC143886710 n=1 Tax=Tasmannia lanceolata TaxID=3420 RepID=UPI0040646D06
MSKRELRAKHRELTRNQAERVVDTYGVPEVSMEPRREETNDDGTEDRLVRRLVTALDSPLFRMERAIVDAVERLAIGPRGDVVERLSVGPSGGVDRTEIPMVGRGGGLIELQEEAETLMADYMSTRQEFRDLMSFRDFCTWRAKNSIPRAGIELRTATDRFNRVPIPHYDGTPGRAARSWMQKLEVFFEVDEMLEADKVRYAILHLDGAAHDWWHQGRRTLDHDQVTHFADFNRRLLQMFDQVPTKQHFRELADLRQTAKLRAYVDEFRQLSLMVDGLSAIWLSYMFVQGLKEPLRGWVSAFDPPNLEPAMAKALTMEASASFTTPNRPNPVRPPSSFEQGRNFGLNPTGHRPPYPQQQLGPPSTNSPSKGVVPIEDMSRTVMRQMRVCFKCRGPWEPGHKCSQFQIVEVHPESGTDIIDGNDRDEVKEDDTELQQQQVPSVEGESNNIRLHTSLASLSGVPNFHAFRVKGRIEGHHLVILIDTGATHNFIDQSVVTTL